jgi:hypothetical protein
MLKKRSKDTLKHISQVLWIRKMFKIFKPGSPDNKLGLEECLHLKISANGSGAWLSDRNCTAKFIFARLCAERNFTWQNKWLFIFQTAKGSSNIDTV